MDDLKSKLAVQEIELQQKNEDADKLIKVVGQQTDIVTKNKKIADEEEKKVQVINEVACFAIMMTINKVWLWLISINLTIVKL